jgi:ATP-dependent helicase/nuclease subunit A
MSDRERSAGPAVGAKAASIAHSDAELRRRVLRPGPIPGALGSADGRWNSWLLQAPAGSGKTELLMQRYLACLAAVEQPESVLAITFTRKAASEMRCRILSSLQRSSAMSEHELADLPPHERQSLELAREVLAVSARLGWNILSYPARLQVRTLDSFCEAVAQRAPLKGLLGGAVQVTEDAKPLYEMAAQRVIDELAVPGKRGDAVAELLSYRDNRVGDVRDLVAAMLAQREQWLHILGRSDAFDPSQQQVLQSQLESALAFAVEEELELVRTRAAATLTPAQQHELFALMRYSAEQLTRAEVSAQPVESIAAAAEVVAMPDAAAAAMAAAGSVLQPHPLREIAAWPPASSDALPLWREIAQFLLVSDGPTLRKKVDVRNGFPPGTAHPKRCKELLEHIRQLPGRTEFCKALDGVRRLPDPHYSESQWRFMLALLELLPLAAAHLQVVFSEQGTIDFGEYALRALHAIGEDDAPSELGLQLGYRIRHVLVDEFQDTNRVQVELLARLLATWDAGEMCSIFCVGDPMQSIYAFRQADLAMYRQAQRDGIGGTPLQFGCLSQNFRSQEKLVRWFNAVFAQIFRGPSDLTNAVDYAPAEATRPGQHGAAVAIKGFASGNRAGEARYLVECIQRELDLPDSPGSKPSTIAVLVRARRHLLELVEAMRAAKIPYRAVKTDRLADRPLVRDLEALRAALTDLANRTAWLAVLRAPWCGLALADLLELCRNDCYSTVLELLRERRERLSVEGRIALARCLPVLEEALLGRGRGNLRTLVESTWLRLGGPACEADCAQAARDAHAYFELLDEQSRGDRLCDAKTFAAKLGELFAPADPAAGIRVEIMPIHQAKGLQWDVVFLPALDRRTRQEDKRLLYWRSLHPSTPTAGVPGTPRRRGTKDLLLLGPMEPAGKKKERKKATVEGYLRDLATECAQEELKRLFYVAATRACNRLYLSASLDADKKPDRNSMLRLLWDVPGMPEHFAPEMAQFAEDASGVAAEIAAGVAEENASPDAPSSDRLLRRFPSSIVSPPRPPLPPPLEWSVPPANANSGEQHRFEWVGELLPRVGVVAHSFLQRIAADGLPLWDAAQVEAARPAIAAALANAGVGPGELEQGTARVIEALRRTLEDERGRWLLSPHPDHRSELALSAVIDGELQHVRIDRTFIDNGTRWLIDYKITEQLGSDPQRFVQMQVEKYRPDMQRYARVLRAMDAGGSGRAPQPVRCALYLPLLGQFCEVEV